MMSLTTVGEDAYYHNQYYEVVKRLMIQKLFDVKEPNMKRIRKKKISIFMALILSDICNFF